MKSILKLPEVIKRVSLSRSSIYSFASKGQFPKPIPLGGRSVGWLSTEIDEWIDQQSDKAREAQA